MAAECYILMKVAGIWVVPRILLMIIRPMSLRQGTFLCMFLRFFCGMCTGQQNQEEIR